ncbi:MAG: ThuA domain-containing protein [Leeuwenhoekiella sp.]
MKRFLTIFCIASVILVASCKSNVNKASEETDQALLDSAEKQNGKSLIIFSKTNGFRHKSIANGIKTISSIAEEKGLSVIATEDSLFFNTENLDKAKIVVFLSTTGDILGAAEEKAFENYIQSGGTYLGIHAASDTEFDWPWYGKFVGAYFDGHPSKPNVREAKLYKGEPHVTTEHWTDTITRNDEWYNYKNLNMAVTPTLFLDETSYEGGRNGEYHPIAWYHNYDGGKVYYTGGGHTEESFDEPGFKEHLERAVVWLMEE